MISEDDKNKQFQFSVQEGITSTELAMVQTEWGVDSLWFHKSENVKGCQIWKITDSKNSNISTDKKVSDKKSNDNKNKSDTSSDKKSKKHRHSGKAYLDAQWNNVTSFHHDFLAKLR
eukprot:CAMPEP_0114534060 /NCGR_PEP_ID=MMETSP0109-20121206/27613_1 /TAXON_ID=29199 /ORGANISM="Chlorarachnion reptans, Strain CCCM449" /LENGTH=116 /DNA_ID=CAMNT_0001717397 /DNA_START=881 /DNA_END=1231 /DNA_ORIENTATION=+